MKIIRDLRPLVESTSGHAQEHIVVDAQPLGIGMERAVLKFQEHSANEILGYALAHAASLPVPRAVAAWFDPDDGLAFGDVMPGDLGILIDYRADWRPISRGEAAAIDSAATGEALALCAFDRHEWGEFGLAGGTVLFVDLERLLPALDARWLLQESSSERTRYLRETTRFYVMSSESFAREAINEAIDLGAIDGFRAAVQRMMDLTDDDWRRIGDLRPHPIAEIVGEAAIRAARFRLGVVRRLLADSAWSA